MSKSASEKQVVLVVDDTAATRRIMSRMLVEHAEVLVARSGEEAISTATLRHPALILLDVEMPGLDGYETCRRLKDIDSEFPIHVMLVSARDAADERLRGYAAGADDFLAKPFDERELLAKVGVHLRLRAALHELEQTNRSNQQAAGRLSQIVDEQACGLMVARQLTAQALASLAESRDPETGHHLERMRDYAVVIAEDLMRDGAYADQIDPAFAERLWHAAPLHDVGKVGVPDSVLKKPGRLDRDEFIVMQQHTEIGANVLEAIHDTETGAGMADDSSFMPMAVDIARSHHERWDGTGYPDTLSGTDIPLAARIVAVADVFDALTSARVYKPAFPPETARAVILKGSGRHFDPVVVAAFESAWDELQRIHAAFESLPSIDTDMILDDDAPGPENIPDGQIIGITFMPDQEGAGAAAAEFAAEVEPDEDRRNAA